MHEKDFYDNVYGRNIETCQVSFEEQFDNLVETVWKLQMRVEELEQKISKGRDHNHE